jgi:hypothetical protein
MTIFTPFGSGIILFPTLDINSPMWHRLSCLCGS